MHAAPPVRVRLPRDRVAPRAAAAVAAVAAANLVAWLLAWPEPGVAVTLAASAAAAALAAWPAYRMAQRALPAGELGWDGRQWQWQAEGGGAIDGEVEIALDLDRWLLLRFRGPRTQWIAAARASAPALWAPLRSALIWPRPADAPAAAPVRDD